MMLRHGFILVLSCCFSLTAFAMDWTNLWRTPDQQGKTLYDVKEYGQAQQKFQRADWRALAAYRAQNFSQAAKDYLGLQTASGFYNAGNALAFSQEYAQAIKAYDQALRMNPKDRDALFNRRVVQKLLQEQQNKEQPKDGNNATDSSSQSKEDLNASQPKNQNQNSSQQASSAPEKQPLSKSSPTSKNQAQAQPKDKTAKKTSAAKSTNEQQEANAQWLKLIPDDPGGLLRQKFLRDHLKRQNGSWS